MEIDDSTLGILARDTGGLQVSLAILEWRSALW